MRTLGGQMKFFDAVTILLCLLPFWGCSANIKQMAIAKGGAVGIEKACEKATLQGCSELGEGFKNYILEDKKKSAEHINAAIGANANIKIDDLAKMMDMAATLAGPQAEKIKQFTTFLVSVAEYSPASSPQTATSSAQAPQIAVSNPRGTPTPSDPASVPQSPSQFVLTPPTEGGCHYDVQCKTDRLCVNGRCVSPAVAEQMELRILASLNPSAAFAYKRSLAMSSKDQALEPSVPPENTTAKKYNARQCVARCEKGREDGCYAAGVLYETGQDVVVNNQFAADSYKKACMLGSMSGCVRLGNMFFYGKHSDANYETAHALYLQACNEKDMYGCANIAMLFQLGLGVKQDLQKSKDYFNQACELGHDISCNNIDKAPSQKGPLGSAVSNSSP